MGEGVFVELAFCTLRGLVEGGPLVEAVPEPTYSRYAHLAERAELGEGEPLVEAVRVVAVEAGQLLDELVLLQLVDADRAQHALRKPWERARRMARRMTTRMAQDMKGKRKPKKHTHRGDNDDEKR